VALIFDPPPVGPLFCLFIRFLSDAVQLLMAIIVSAFSVLLSLLFFLSSTTFHAGEQNSSNPSPDLSFFSL